MSALRCSNCGVNWPNDPKNYQTCPVCQVDTSVFWSERAMDADEAKSLRLHVQFDRYCQLRDEQRVA